jgi:hypothetical protein
MTIQSGTFIFDSSAYPQLIDNDPGGDRSAQNYIPFATAFTGTPTVVVSLNRIDIGSQENSRVLLATDTINANGFELIVTTWADTVLYSAGVSWIAYGD